jgi:hypothetical protein
MARDRRLVLRRLLALACTGALAAWALYAWRQRARLWPESPSPDP